jgi:ubiquinol-cytochrome c reductase cytochrome b subunit
VVFTALFLWPFLERGVTGDRRVHNLLDRPRDAPWRTALGAALVSWVLAVFMAGSADRVYVTFGIDYQTQVSIYRIAIWVVPIVVLVVTKRVCDGLRAAEQAEE